MFRIRSKLLQFRFKGLAEKEHSKALDAIRQSGKPVENLLFLCYGNICRSPVAERLAIQRYLGAEVSSAGFYPQEGRSAPDNIRIAAQQLGIDMSNWASRRVTREMVRRADLIILMDLQNFRDFRREFSSEHKKVVLLGLLLDPPQLAIADPYGEAAAEIVIVLKQIEAGVAALGKCLPSTR